MFLWAHVLNEVHPKITIVDAVMFLDCPFGLYDFVQGAGQAGRSSQESLIAILHKGPIVLPEENIHGCQAEMGTG